MKAVQTMKITLVLLGKQNFYIVLQTMNDLLCRRLPRKRLKLKLHRGGKGASASKNYIKYKIKREVLI